MKSAARVSQLISQKNVWGINCEIQGVSMVVPPHLAFAVHSMSVLRKSQRGGRALQGGELQRVGGALHNAVLHLPSSQKN